MCTLIAVHRQVPGHPLLVAANRDEFLDRPSEGPSVRETRVGRVLAPRDIRAGGTWLGLNEQGVFVALTNLRTEAPDPSRRSRGDLVIEALGASSAAEAAVLLETLDEEAYNPFNLFVADGHEALVAVYRDQARVAALEPGAHVIGNVEATGPDNAKVERIRREVDGALAGSNEGLIERLAEICRSHAGERDELHGGPQQGSSPLDDTCVHIGATHMKGQGIKPNPIKGTRFEGMKYGTRSSLLLDLGEDLATSRLLHTDGPPCETAYEDVSSLLIELGRRPAVDTAESLMRSAS